MAPLLAADCALRAQGAAAHTRSRFVQPAPQMGGLHPRASLFEKPVNLDAAKQAHAEFRRVMREKGVRVLTVRGASCAAASLCAPDRGLHPPACCSAPLLCCCPTALPSCVPHPALHPSCPAR